MYMLVVSFIFIPLIDSVLSSTNREFGKNDNFAKYIGLSEYVRTQENQ